MDIEHRILRISLGAVVMTPHDPAIFGIPIDFILFGLTSPGVAVFHQHTMRVPLAGLVTVVFYKILFAGIKTGPRLIGFVSHVKQEWVIGGALVHQLFRAKVHIGYVAAIVPASNAGGAWRVLGDRK